MRPLRFSRRLLAVLFAFIVCCIPAARAQDMPPDIAPRPSSTPYTGDLSIFDKPGRDQRLQIERVMDLLGLKPGKSVADIGAGSGWFSVRAARRIAPSGTVYAEDINPEAITYIRQRAAHENLPNVHVIEGTPDNPKLMPASIDAVLMLKVYHEVANPLELLRNLRRALRPDARIGVIDRNGNGTDHGVNASVVIHEMDEAGFALSGRYDFTKADGQDYFLIFTQRH
jgi:SAM-dependent methyltransferase